MAKQAKTVEIVVVSQQGTCAVGHTVGETFVVPGDSDRFQTPGICIHALITMLPKVLALRYGAAFPWAKEGVVNHACPDAKNPCVFQLRVLD